MDTEFQKFITSTHKVTSSDVQGDTAKVVVETPKVSTKKSSGITVEEFNDQMDISIAQLESVAVMAQTMAMIQAAEEGTN